MFSNTFRKISALFCQKRVPAYFHSTYNVQRVVKCSVPRLQSLATPVMSDPSFIGQNKNKLNILDVPTVVSNILYNPKRIIPFEDNVYKNIIEDPTKIIEKRAARMIVIRRRKMKRHRLKKLRLKMKFIWGKVRQRREAKKEKAFQQELMCQVKDAERFNASVYVKEKILKSKYDPAEDMWEGKSPEEIAYRKKLLAEKERKKALKEELLESRKRINYKISDDKF